MIREIVSYFMYFVCVGGMLVFISALNLEMGIKGWQEFSMSARLRMMRISLSCRWLKFKNMLGYNCGVILARTAAKLIEKTADSKSRMVSTRQAGYVHPEKV